MIRENSPKEGYEIATSVIRKHWKNPTAAVGGLFTAIAWVVARKVRGEAIDAATETARIMSACRRTDWRTYPGEKDIANSIQAAIEETA